MLKIMRQGATSGITKTIIFGLLMMGAVGLAFTGGFGFFRDGIRQDDTVAKVGNAKISAAAFDEVVRRTLAQQSLDAQTAYKFGYIDQLLNSYVDNQLFALAAHDAGLVVSDNMVTEQLRKLVAPFVNENTSAKDALRTIMRVQNMSEGQLIEEMRSETAKTLLRNALQTGAAITSENDVTDLALFREEKRSVEYVYLPSASVKDYKEPSDEVLKPFYEAGQERYAVPEARSFTVAILSAPPAGDASAVTDADIQKAYEEQKDTFTKPEQRGFEQVILDRQEDAQKVADAARADKPLIEAVKDVMGSARGYTGTEDYQQEGLDKAVADAVFKAGKGAIIGPIESSLGWHVIVLNDIKPNEAQPLEAVKDQIRKDLVADKDSQSLYEASTQMDDQLAGGASFDELVKTYNLQTVAAGPVHRDGSTPDKKDGMKELASDSKTVLDTAFSLSEGETSMVVGLSGNRYAAIRLDAMTPKTYQPFAEVRGDLAKLWIADQQDVLNRQHAEDALKALKEGKTTLQALASERGASLKTATLARMDNPAEPLGGESKEAFFSADPDVFVTAPAKDGLLIGRVTNISLPDVKAIPAEALKETRTIAAQAVQNEIFDVYMKDLRKKYKVKINRDRLQAMYDKPQDGAPEDVAETD